jgi:hypothetical protein
MFEGWLADGIPWGALLLLAATAWAAAWLTAKVLRPPAFPYERRGPLAPEPELKLYRQLRQAADGWAVFPMVRLADVVRVKADAAKAQAWRNRIQAKRLDFVVCDPHSLQVLVAVELEDPSGGPDRATRDAFLDEALAKAGLPLLRVPRADQYDADALRQELLRRMPK